MTHTGLPAGVSVHLALPPRLPPLTVDEQRMVTVFDHLLANAAQAMPDGGTIGVFASAQGKAVTIAVGDTGTGIKPEDMKHLFEPLFSTKALGAGIGLAMCKAFVEADGGRISVKSAPGRGTTVTVTLPTA
jgi:signal transduction histidine kinase